VSKKAKRQKVEQKLAKRTYAGARAGRLAMTAGTSSADGELYTSLITLRNRSRALVRDVVYAKRAKTVVVNNVIGPGVGLQAQVGNTRGGLNQRVNDAIEVAWDSWCRADSCHTGGALHFADLERAAMSEVFEAGECFIRLHPMRVGDSAVPLALELIEAERLADDFEVKPPPGAAVTMGIEHDSFGRPIAYYVHREHPNTLRLSPGRKQDEILRIPAEQMVHLRIVERWPQTRGAPWLHSAINGINQLGEYVNAAVVAARIGASKVGFFESPDGDPNALADGQEADGDGGSTPSMKVEAGEFTQLPPGYKFTSWDPNYPTEAFDPFMRAVLRGIAAGVGVSYESLSRDYSQSNYSSSRLALLDDRDLWRVLQRWWIRSFREPLHARWLQAAVLAGAIPAIGRAEFLENPEKFAAASWKPRGWSWVDPTKEVQAFKEAERAGYTTKADIIAATAGGQDIEDVLRARKRELDLLAEFGLTTDTTTPVAAAPVAAPAEPDANDATEPEDAGAEADTEDDEAPQRAGLTRVK
jgi:lambda family phage portal protein